MKNLSDRALEKLSEGKFQIAQWMIHPFLAT